MPEDQLESWKSPGASRCGAGLEETSEHLKSWGQLTDSSWGWFVTRVSAAAERHDKGATGHSDPGQILGTADAEYQRRLWDSGACCVLPAAVVSDKIGGWG